ncbi:hypothetical protein HID58_057429 [Brassica napus]|uniref:Zinc knuckle CX2CX4HX4C domain-containing protein n=1 Tax=Brassica napus TaxID=3708 RepID=A0ABQ8ASJ1_BRANA|nr:hypothetical protein HID58_057429 [Brassica napus]
MKMRVHVNGLLPLITSTVIEYSNGEEVSASLVYERLERHCTTCLRLDHDIHDCLEEKAKKREIKNAQDADHSKQASFPSGHVRSPLREDTATLKKNMAAVRTNLNQKPGRRKILTGALVMPGNELVTLNKGSSSAKSQLRNGEKGIPLPNPTSTLNEEALQRARDEVRDAMLQYTKTADPTEREARIERMRQAEEQGDLDTAAAQMVQAALTANAERQVREDVLPTIERIPATQRLSLPSSQERIPVSKRLGASASLAPRLDHGDCELVEMQESEERIPATLRIGHLPIPQQEKEPGDTTAPVKRKPGRPP